MEEIFHSAGFSIYSKFHRTTVNILVFYFLIVPLREFTRVWEDEMRKKA